MGILARRALCTSFDRLQRPANFLDPHELIGVDAPWISLEKRDAEEPSSSLERGDHEDECRCNQTAGAAKRRAAPYAFCREKSCDRLVGRRVTSSWRLSRRRGRARRVGDRPAYSQAFDYRSFSRPITRYR